MQLCFAHRSLATRCLILLGVATSGCGSPTSPTKQTFGELVDRVRRGESTQIVNVGEPVGDEALALLSDLPDLKHLAIEQFEGTAVGLEYVAQLSNLERLQLRGGDLDDEAMAVIAKCGSLKNVNLPDARFTDAGLAALKSLPNLELLRIRTSHVTDDGLRDIAEMTSLRFLHLIGVPITDQGLAHLESMERLESFYVDDAPITDEGIERLLEANPGLHIHINQRHSDRDPSRGTHSH